MKTQLLIIIATVMISLFGYSQYADALCMENQDWSDAPCYGCIGCYPGLEQEKIDWSPYYDFKGKEWMDAKKQQLETAIHNNSLREWFVQSDSGAHKNVHKYYFLQGDVPNIYGMNFDEALGFERAWNAVEDDSPDAPLFLWTYHDVILDGTLIETDLAVTITGDHVPLYHIKANKYFKGEKNSDMITAVENPDDLEFDLFENGLFYLKKLENQNMYTATIASAKTFGNCDARSLIEISPHLPNEKPPVSMSAHPIGIDPCVPDYFDVDPDGIVFEDVPSEPEQNIPTYADCGEGTSFQDGICVVEEQTAKTNSTDKWPSPYQSITQSPLKQINLGVKFHNIKCDEGIVLAKRGNSERSACVTLDTKIELTIRGWADDDRVILGCIGERVQKCYPEDKDEYRKKLQKYYYGFNEEPDSKIDVSCMSMEASKSTAIFFKIPSYLSEDYSFKCSFSGTPYESYLIFDNKKVPDGWISHIPELVSEGAVFIYQTDQKSAVSEKKYATYGTATQRIQETYDDVMTNNPSLYPQLIHINGMLAFAVDFCNDCSVQTANFTDRIIQKSTSSEDKIKFIDENGTSYLLKAGIPLSELIKVAESLQ